MGYCFVNTCSRCDYYLQNRNLNNKALTLPWLQLSKLWQCTSLHKVGDLYHSQCTQTPYQPILPKKSNSFICSDRSSSSGSKRVRLFEAATPNANAENKSPLPSAQSLNLRNKQVQQDSVAVTVAKSERDMALAERDTAFAERDAAFVERDIAYSKADSAKVECYKAMVERDHALNDRDVAMQQSKSQAEKIDDLENAIEALQWKLDEKVEENKLLLENKERTDALLMVYSENLTRLNGRVAALEVLQSRSSNMTVGTRGRPLQYITRFASKLFPELNKKQQLTSIFDVLYSNKKSFRAYAKTQIQEDLLPEMRMKLCIDIQKQFAAWKFLAVLDCSNQSLNQVRLCF
jgi:hypothetical protein